MATLLIGYDLNKPGKDYDDLISAIKALGAWWHYLDSTWIVKAAATPMQVCNALRVHIDGNDELLVVDISNDGAAWVGFDASASAWLKENI